VTEIFSPRTWRIRDRLLSTGDHTLVMGIVNATPDSFSDGGLHNGVRDAIAHGLEQWEQGADIVDVGGESTRPGAVPVPVAEEIERVVPVIAGLVARDVVVSVDTMKAPVAAAAVVAGAQIVNDITALSDPEMARVCAESGVGVILMHMQGTPQTMQDNPSYGNVVAEVLEYLEDRARFAIESGIEAESIVIDPGIGFGKDFQHNLDILTGIARFSASGFPVLIGTSRKGFLGQIMRSAGFETAAIDRDGVELVERASRVLLESPGKQVLAEHVLGLLAELVCRENVARELAVNGARIHPLDAYGHTAARNGDGERHQREEKAAPRIGTDVRTHGGPTSPEAWHPRKKERTVRCPFGAAIHSRRLPACPLSDYGLVAVR